jgi:hypothetical protein
LLRIDDIVASPSNPRKRFDDAYIAELAESIKNHGLIQPITVRPLDPVVELRAQLLNVLAHQAQVHHHAGGRIARRLRGACAAALAGDLVPS